MKTIKCPHCKQETEIENVLSIPMEQMFICESCGTDITKEIEWFNMNTKPDMLEQIYHQQFELQASLGTLDKIEESPQMRQQFINQMILALHEEATEIMRETAYKNPDFVPFGWKKKQVENTDKFKEEIIDIIHFVMNLAIVSGMEPKEIFERYEGKNKENHERKENGY